jgi:hypothetical protein
LAQHASGPRLNWWQPAGTLSHLGRRSPPRTREWSTFMNWETVPASPADGSAIHCPETRGPRVAVVLRRTRSPAGALRRRTMDLEMAPLFVWDRVPDRHRGLGAPGLVISVSTLPERPDPLVWTCSLGGVSFGPEPPDHLLWLSDRGSCASGASYHSSVESLAIVFNWLRWRRGPPALRWPLPSDVVDCRQFPEARVRRRIGLFA